MVFARGALFVALLFLSCSAWGQLNCDYKLKPSDQHKLNQAVELYNQKKYAQSNEILKRLLSHNPQSPDVLFYLGMNAVQRDFNVGGIRRYFTRLFDHCNDYPNALAHYYMGIVNYTDEKFDLALVNFNRFFEIANTQSHPSFDAVYEEASNYKYWSEFLADAMMNKAPFNPVVLKGASSRSHEWMPYVTVDGKMVYYIRQVSLNKEYTFYKKELDQRVPRLCCSYLRDTVFSPGEELPAPFNMNESEGGVTITADNKLLYYSVMKQGKNGYANCDIYYSNFRDGAWQPVRNAGGSINGDRTWESQPSITPDGQWLYFASNRQGGAGGIDIWRCRRLSNGDWSRAENMGPSVNTPGNEKSPFIHADGKTLYFASDGWQGFGGYDMYFIDVSNVAMQRPTNMGLPFNTEDDDICLGVTTDGLKGYFAAKMVSDKIVGGRDIFTFGLYPAARPERMAVVAGSVALAAGKCSDVRLAVFSSAGERFCFLVDSADGSYQIVLSAQEDNLVAVTAEGYLPFVKCVPFKLLRNQSANPLGKVIEMEPVRVGSVVLLHDVCFDRGKDVLSLPGKSVLDRYVSFLHDHPMVHVSVESIDLKLAKAIYDYLLSRKLRNERLSYKSSSTAGPARLVVTQK